MLQVKDTDPFWFHVLQQRVTKRNDDISLNQDVDQYYLQDFTQRYTLGESASESRWGHV
jgi:hypothetical protein